MVDVDMNFHCTAESCIQNRKSRHYQLATNSRNLVSNPHNLAGLDAFLHCRHSEAYQQFYDVLGQHGWHSVETFKLACKMHNEFLGVHHLFKWKHVQRIYSQTGNAKN